MEQREIAGFPGYYVYEDGRVWSEKSGKLLKQGTNGNYPTVFLCKDGCPKRFYIHRLVALAFLGNPEGKREVNHKDANKNNNHASNLEWATRSENLLHINQIGMGTRGERNGSSVLTASQVSTIRELHESGALNQRQLGEKFGVSRATIGNIVSFKTWKDAA